MTLNCRASLLGAFVAVPCLVACSGSASPETAPEPVATAGGGGSSASSGAPAAGAPSSTGGGASGGTDAVGGSAPTAGYSNGGSPSGGAGALGGSGAAGGGSAGAPPGGSGGGGSACPADAVFCDDFESYAEMTQPNGKWKTWTVGNGTLLVDAAHGSKAAHFHGKVSQGNSGGTKEQAFMLAQQAPAFPVSSKTLYLRFMLYGTRYPFTGVSDANHIAMAWIGSTKALSSPDRGATNEGFILADYNGVSIEPMWSGYYRDTSKHFKDANQANAWHCWEVEIDNQNGPPAGGATGPALPHIWEDGAELKLSEKGGGNYAAIPFEAVLFSLWSPQNDTAVADYWVDDVAVSKSRINCPASK